MSELGLAADAVAFVDDDAMERAEVSFRLPDVLVLEPRDMADAAGWPQFSPPVDHRGGTAARRAVPAAPVQAGGGAGVRRIQGGVPAVLQDPGHDQPGQRQRTCPGCTNSRSARTSSTRRPAPVPEAEFAGLLGPPAAGVHGQAGGPVRRRRPRRRLRHRAAEPCRGGQRSWHVPMLMMSCRALGRGVIDALLTWICRAARAGGAARSALTCVISPRNVPLRIALTGAGFRAADARAPAAAAPRVARLRRPLGEPLPDLPGWVTVTGDRRARRPSDRRAQRAGRHRRQQAAGRAALARRCSAMASASTRSAARCC